LPDARTQKKICGPTFSDSLCFHFVPMNIFRLFLLAVSLSSLLPAAPFTALQDGEKFRYRTGWGIFAHAGEVVIEAHRVKMDGRSVFRLTTQISSRGIVRGLYTFDDRGELLIDEATGQILLAKDEGRSGSKRLHSETVFDYERHVARHTDHARPERNREFAIPDGDPIDLISALIQTREWKLELGQRRDALVYFGRDVYPITITADGLETVRGPKGQISTMRLIPRMETEEPRGVFKRGGEIKVWVSQSSPRLPVQMQLKLNLGTAMLTLIEHTVTPQTAGPAAPAP